MPFRIAELDDEDAAGRRRTRSRLWTTEAEGWVLTTAAPTGATVTFLIAELQDESPAAGFAAQRRELANGGLQDEHS